MNGVHVCALTGNASPKMQQMRWKAKRKTDLDHIAPVHWKKAHNFIFPNNDFFHNKLYYILTLDWSSERMELHFWNKRYVDLTFASHSLIFFSPNATEVITIYSAIQDFILIVFFSLFLFLPISLVPTVLAGNRKDSRKVEFSKAKNGQQFLMIDQHRYFKDRENAMVIFWKCHEFHKSKCEASVATMKKDRYRVVVMNDTHIHLTPKKPATRRRK